MNGVAVGCLCNGKERLGIEVALSRRRGAYAVGMLGQLHVERLAVGLGVHHHGFDIELAARAEHAHGNLAAVGDEDTLEHASHLALTARGSE